MKDKTIENKIYLDEFKNKNGIINWSKTLHKYIKFKYGDIEDSLYVSRIEGVHLYINYKDIENYKIEKRSIRKCELKKLLSPYIDFYNYSIKERIYDNKRDLIIIDRKTEKNKMFYPQRNKTYNSTVKYYKYKCNKCGFDCGEHYKHLELLKDLWIAENELKQGQGCSCCSGKIIVEGINDIPTTAPWMIKYFQGGYDEAKKYTYRSSYRISPVCPTCGKTYKDMKIDDLFSLNGGICCDDKTCSFSEKFIILLLNNLNINYIKEFRTDWSLDKRYDFYFSLNNEEYIIETHGIQHYKGSFEKMSGKGLKYEQENDLNKYNIAISNGIKPENYIVIDCRKSNFEFIKNNILHSRLNEIFDLTNINWIDIELKIHDNNPLIKKVCDYWNDNEDVFPKEIAEKFCMGRNTVIKYLKLGTKYGYTNYDSKEDSKKQISLSKKGRKRMHIKYRHIEVFKNNESLGVFNNCKELIDYFKKIYNINFNSACIYRVCRGERNHYKGYLFKYTN